MKRYFKRIGAFLLIISLLFLVSCKSSESGSEYETIKLTKENYSEYISINAYVSDFTAIISEQTEISTRYNLSLVVHIETSKKVDCEFEDVSITYSPYRAALWQYSSFPSATLNLDGESHTSFVATRTDCPFLDCDTSRLTSTKGIVQSIEGYVILPKEQD